MYPCREVTAVANFDVTLDDFKEADYGEIVAEEHEITPTDYWTISFGDHHDDFINASGECPKPIYAFEID